MMKTMKKSRPIFMATLAAVVTVASSAAQQPAPSKIQPQTPSSAVHEAQAGRGYSGMYGFLREGEFVQITVEDEGKVTGFVSRYADTSGQEDSRKEEFVDQFFHSGKLEGNKLSFTTETVRGMSFDFKGSVERGEGKNPADEAYYILKGMLIDNVVDAQKKVTPHSQEVTLKRFPAT